MNKKSHVAYNFNCHNPLEKKLFYHKQTFISVFFVIFKVNPG